MKYDRKKGVFVLDENFFIDKNGLRHYRDSDKKELNQFYGISPFDGEDDEEIKRAAIFAWRVSKRKTINKNVSSYALKHYAEEYLRRTFYSEKRAEAYVSNGALIVAMIKAGYRYAVDKPYFEMMGFHSPNVMFNVSIEGVKR